MHKSKTVLEIKVNDRTYEFLCELDSPLGEVYDVINRMRSHIVQLIADAHEKERQASDVAEVEFVKDEPAV